MKQPVLIQISDREFCESDPLFRVIVHENPRKYASLQLPEASHALFLCWRSDLVDAVVVLDPHSSVVWIGVDQRVVCISTQGNTLFSAGLSSPLLQVKCFESCVVILCESEALVINYDYSLRTMCDLREIADDVDLHEGKLVVTQITGESEVFSI